MRLAPGAREGKSPGMPQYRGPGEQEPWYTREHC